MATEALQIDALWSGLNDPKNGKSYGGAIVATFAADGSTPKAVWEDKEKTAPTTAGKSQFNLDSNGQAEVFGDGVYTIKVYDSTDTGLTSPIMTFDGLTYINPEGALVVGVDSIVDLRAGTGGESDGEVATLLYHTAPGDNGGGDFYWDATSTDTDNGGTIIKVTSVTTGRWIRINSQLIISADWFGANGAADGTAEIQAAVDVMPNVEFSLNGSYTFGSISLPTEAQINGNGATFTPLSSPDQLFLVTTSGGVRAFRDMKIGNFNVAGDVTNIVYITGSSWGDISVRDINSLSGTGFAIVRTNILTGTNPSGLTLKNLNARHSSGYKYGWYSSADAVTASIDNADIDHINIWPITNGYPVFVNHVLSANSYVTRLYHGAGGGAGGGIINVYQMVRGTIGNLWGEASDGDIDALQGSYRDVDINKIVMQTNTATESGDTRFVKAHMFNCSINMCVFTDDNASGYERDDSPPTNYECFVFEEDASSHISRDVRIGNAKGNFDETNIVRDTGQGIYYTEKPGSSYINTKFDSEVYDTTTTGILVSPGYQILDVSNWEWGYLEEGLKITITGRCANANAMDVRFLFDNSAIILGQITNTPAASSFVIEAFLKTFNDGADKIRLQGYTLKGDTIENNNDNGSSNYSRTDSKSSGLYIYAVTLNAADSITVDYISVEPVRSTVR